MVMGTETENQLGKRVHTVLWQALAIFFANPHIQQQFSLWNEAIGLQRFASL
jgi:hypothetical protein